MNFNAENIKTYEALAQEYEKNIPKYSVSTKEAVEKLIPGITTGKGVLDIGCGVGLGTMMLISKGFSVTSIDISPKMIEFTRSRNPKAITIVGDFLEYKFKKEFDAIFAMAFIHLFPKEIAELNLKKMYDLLKEGGALYIGTTLSHISKEGFELKNDSFFPNGGKKRYRKHWTEQELLESLQKAGFKYKSKYHIDDPRNKTWMGFLMSK
jgi:SAM-dependent methyltransferase